MPKTQHKTRPYFPLPLISLKNYIELRFISVSAAAGAPANRKRGLFLAGAAYVPSDTALAGGVNDIVPDVLNLLYYGARDAAADTLLPDEEEFDITVDYRVVRSVAWNLVPSPQRLC